MDIVRDMRNFSDLNSKIETDNLLIDLLGFKVINYKESSITQNHMHLFFEFHFIHSGSCLVKINENNEFIAKEGEFFITGPGVYHKLKDTGTNKFIEYCMSCGIRLIEGKPSEAYYMLKILSETPCKKLSCSDDLSLFLDDLLNETTSQKIGVYNKIKCIVMDILIETVRVIRGKAQIEYEKPIWNEDDNYILYQIERFIEDNVFNPITITDVSRSTYFSERQVYRIIKEKRGISTKELITQIKLKKAKELLKDTNLSIKQISDKLGFGSENYFNKFFKKQNGDPPGYYRTSLKHVYLPYIEDFENGITNSWMVLNGNWDVILDDSKVYHSSHTDQFARSVVGQALWNNYEISVRVKVNLWGTEDNIVGILARYQNNINYYLFIYKCNQEKLCIIKQINGAFIKLVEIDYKLNTGIWYAFKVILNGFNFEFHINDILQLTTRDTDLVYGKVGFIQCSCDVCFDDLIITEGTESSLNI